MNKNILAQKLFENNVIDPSIYDFSVLLENRIDFIKNKYKGSMDALVDHYASNVDPTPNKKFTEWLVQRHVAGDTIDPNEVKEGLTHFQKASSAVHDTNIKNHSVKSMLDVAHLVKTLPQKQVGPETGTEEIYNKDGVTGYRIKDKDTMTKLYGYGRKYSSRWCTAADSADNAFDGYDGGKYTMHLPNGAFMHIHHESGQVKNPSNTEIDFNSDSKYTPYRENVREFMDKTENMENGNLPTDHHSLSEKHFGPSDEKFKKSWNDFENDTMDENDTENTFKAGIKTRPLSDEQFDKVMDYGYASHVANNPHLTHDQVGKIMDNGGFAKNSLMSNSALKGEHLDRMLSDMIDSHTLHNVGKLVNLQPHHIDHILSLPNKADMEEGIDYLSSSGKHHFSDAQIDRISDEHKLPGMVRVIADHQEVPEKHRRNILSYFANNISSGVAKGWELKNFADHNKIHDSELHQLISYAKRTPKHNKASFLSHVLQLPTVKPDHAASIAHAYDDEPSIPVDVISKPAFINDEIQKRINDPSKNNWNKYHIEEYSNRPDAKASIIHQMNKTANVEPDRLDYFGYYKKKDFHPGMIDNNYDALNALKNINYHPKANKEFINSILDKTDTNVSGITGDKLSKGIKNLMDHPALNSEHVDKIVNKFGYYPTIMNTIKDHPRTPPSIKEKLMTQQ